MWMSDSFVDAISSIRDTNTVSIPLFRACSRVHPRSRAVRLTARMARDWDVTRISKPSEMHSSCVRDPDTVSRPLNATQTVSMLTISIRYRRAAPRGGARQVPLTQRWRNRVAGKAAAMRTDARGEPWGGDEEGVEEEIAAMSLTTTRGMTPRPFVRSREMVKRDPRQEEEPEGHGDRLPQDGRRRHAERNQEGHEGPHVVELRQVLLLGHVGEAHHIGEQEDRRHDDGRIEPTGNGKRRRQVNENAASAHEHRAERVALVPGVVGDDCRREREARDGRQRVVRLRRARTPLPPTSDVAEAEQEELSRHETSFTETRPRGWAAPVARARRPLDRTRRSGTCRRRSKTKSAALERDAGAGRRNPAWRGSHRERVGPDRGQVRHATHGVATRATSGYDAVASRRRLRRRHRASSPRTHSSSRTMSLVMSCGRSSSGSTSEVYVSTSRWGATGEFLRISNRSRR